VVVWPSPILLPPHVHIVSPRLRVESGGAPKPFLSLRNACLLAPNAFLIVRSAAAAIARAFLDAQDRGWRSTRLVGTLTGVHRGHPSPSFTAAPEWLKAPPDVSDFPTQFFVAIAQM